MSGVGVVLVPEPVGIDGRALQLQHGAGLHAPSPDAAVLHRLLDGHVPQRHVLQLHAPGTEADQLQMADHLPVAFGHQDPAGVQVGVKHGGGVRGQHGGHLVRTRTARV
jgi:hypothetical protein